MGGRGGWYAHRFRKGNSLKQGYSDFEYLLFLVLNGMTFGGKMRKLSDKLFQKLVYGGGLNSSRGYAEFPPPLTYLSLNAWRYSYMIYVLLLWKIIIVKKPNIFAIHIFGLNDFHHTGMPYQRYPIRHHLKTCADMIASHCNTQTDIYGTLHLQGYSILKSILFDKIWQILWKSKMRPIFTQDSCFFFLEISRNHEWLPLAFWKEGRGWHPWTW